MNTKFLKLLMFSICTYGIFVTPDPAQSSHCSNLREKCRSKCKEENRLNDVLERECYDSCKDAYRLCIEERPECLSEDKCDNLERQVRQLEQELRFLKNTIGK